MGDVLSYYERRAEAELRKARAAVHPAVIHAHYCLADLYLERVYGTAPAIDRIGAATAREDGGIRG